MTDWEREWEKNEIFLEFYRLRDDKDVRLNSLFLPILIHQYRSYSSLPFVSTSSSNCLRHRRIPWNDFFLVSLTTLSILFKSRLSIAFQKRQTVRQSVSGNHKQFYELFSMVHSVIPLEWDVITLCVFLCFCFCSFVLSWIPSLYIYFVKETHSTRPNEGKNDFPSKNELLSMRQRHFVLKDPSLSLPVATATLVISVVVCRQSHKEIRLEQSIMVENISRPKYPSSVTVCVLLGDRRHFPWSYFLVVTKDDDVWEMSWTSLAMSICVTRPLIVSVGV